MNAVPNRTYRAWGNIELSKYFLKLHETENLPGLGRGCASRVFLWQGISLGVGAIPGRGRFRIFLVKGVHIGLR